MQETVDAIGELSDAGFGLGAVVVNQVREPLVDEVLLETAAAEPQRVAARVRDDLAAVGVRAAAKTRRAACSARRTTTPSGSSSSAR